tara:strand:- start:212 stop:1291 length:1080 start_codon:yes stop_codon:yes gene_type:complete
MSEPPGNLLSADSEFEAVEQLHALGCTDGLPVIVPTPERVEAMVLATGLEGDLALGEMGPARAVASVRKVAIAAVMAGCLPDHMPVVLAAVQAVLQPEFDLGEMQGTTHCTAPLIIVNGPAREACGGVASGFGALGPGHRANAAIGRALRLAMINIGGARPGSSDMALHGHPGKFTYCVAEDEEQSTLPPWHTSLGYDDGQSAVTVIGAEAPHSVWFVTNADDPNSPERLLRTLAECIANPGSNNVHLGGVGAVTVVLNHEHAAVLTDAGMSREDIQAKLSEYATYPYGRLKAMDPGLKAPPGEPVKAVRDPAKIVLLVAGGAGLYSMVMPSWCAGPHKNAYVHSEIAIDQFCEIPGAA